MICPGGRGAIDAAIQPGEERGDPEGTVEFKAQKTRSLEKRDGDDDVKYPIVRRRAWHAATALRVTQDSLKIPSFTLWV